MKLTAKITLILLASTSIPLLVFGPFAYFRMHEMSAFDFLGAFVFLLLICCCAGLLIGRMATRDIRKIIYDIELISQGETGHTISVSSRNELRTLAQSVNRMVWAIQQRESAMRETQELFKSLAETSSMAVMIFQDDKWVYANPAGETMSGYAKEELYQQNIWDFTHPDYRDYIKIKCRERQAGNTEISRYEFRILRKDGSLRWVHLTGTLFEYKGRHAGLISVMDITERRVAEESLRASESLIRGIFDADPTGVALVYDRVFKRANAMFCKMTGYAEQELLGRSARMLYPNDQEFNRVDDKLYGELSLRGIGTIETRWIRSNGTLIDVLLSAAVLNPGRMNEGIIVTTLDVSELNRAAEALRKTEAMFKTAIEQSPSGIIIADAPDARIHIINSAAFRIRGGKREQLSGIALQDHALNWRLFRPDGSNFPAEQLPLSRAVTEGKISENVEAIIRRDTGEDRFILINAAPIRDAEGIIQAGIVVFHDITERKRAEKEIKQVQEHLIQADKMIALGTLVAGVAHEINNPNNFVMLNTPLIQEIWTGVVPVLEEFYRESGDFKAGGLPYSKIREAVPTLLNGILDGTRRTSSIVRELKNYARPDEVSMEQQVDVNEALRASVSLLQNMIAKKTKKLSITLGENLPPVTGNMQRLGQVFINILQNACEALPDSDSAIQVETACDGTVVSITIGDTGTGIPPENLDQLMNPFFTTKRGCGGTGLGLSISSKIISDHGGRINVHSQLGHGSVFTVLLPLQPVREKKKILIADDDALQRKAMQAVISRNPAYEIRLVDNGTEACIMLGKWRPDLILLDVNMPYMNGAEVCRKIKDDPDFSGLQVIIVTGYLDTRSMQLIQAMGFHNVCEKPFSVDTLQNMVTAVLERPGDGKLLPGIIEEIL